MVAWNVHPQTHTAWSVIKANRGRGVSHSLWEFQNAVTYPPHRAFEQPNCLKCMAWSVPCTWMGIVWLESQSLLCLRRYCGVKWGISQSHVAGREMIMAEGSNTIRCVSGSCDPRGGVSFWIGREGNETVPSDCTVESAAYILLSNGERHRGKELLLCPLSSWIFDRHILCQSSSKDIDKRCGNVFGLE